MPTTHEITLKGLTARVTIMPGNSVGYPAYGIAFDEGYRVAGETDTVTYNGYCHAEIVAKIADELLEDFGIDYEDVWVAVEDSGLHCLCYDDGNEED